MFDGRYIAYPNKKCLQDYFKWRQVNIKYKRLIVILITYITHVFGLWF